MPLNPIPPPTNAPLVDQTGAITWDWLNYFVQSVSLPISETARQLYSTTTASLTASTATTSFPVGALSVGLYRVGYFAKINTPASVSSSLTVTIGFTRNTVPCTFAGTAMTGNATTTVQSNTWLIVVDAASPVTYATTYASVGTAMAYELSVLLEAV